MIRLNLSKKSTDSLVVLCVGSHADDIEIGCGGTLLRLKDAYPHVRFYWVVLSATGVRQQEAAKAAELFTEGCHKDIVLKEFRDGFLPYDGREVKAFFEVLKGLVDPDLIFTHWRGDAHQDHRLVNELTRNTFRDHLILEYEIPKYDGDLGRPNLFVPLTPEIFHKKVHHVLDTFHSQHVKRWFTEDTFLSLMRLRGMECNSPSGYAEALYCHKLVL